jgi:hypothetical protein
MTRLQALVFSLVLAFGAGVLITLECVEADAQERIRSARRAALNCDAGEMLAMPQPGSRGQS